MAVESPQINQFKSKIDALWERTIRRIVLCVNNDPSLLCPHMPYLFSVKSLISSSDVATRIKG
jgi:hypothetical protein